MVNSRIRFFRIRIIRSFRISNKMPCYFQPEIRVLILMEVIKIWVIIILYNRMIIGIFKEVSFSKSRCKVLPRIMMCLIWGRRLSSNCRFKSSNLGSVWVRWKIRLVRLLKRIWMRANAVMLWTKVIRIKWTIVRKI